MLGEMETYKALGLAKERGFDLVEVSPNTRPPICKFQDFGQLKYQQAKAEQKQRKKQKKVEIKGVRISMRISENDMQMKANQALKFLKKGHKVKIELVMRGREKAHGRLAYELIEKFAKSLGDDIIVEQRPKREGRGLGMIVTRKN